jgi:hypothetical protein
MRRKARSQTVLLSYLSLEEWYRERPDLIRKRPYDQPGLDTYQRTS